MLLCTVLREGGREREMACVVMAVGGVGVVGGGGGDVVSARDGQGWVWW